MRLAPFITAILLFTTACAGTRVTTAPPAGAPPSLADAKREVAAYVTSGRYEADIAAVADQARAWVERRATRGGRLAIVLDVDETSLSNLPTFHANDYGLIARGPCELPAGPCGFLAWIEMAQAEPIKPVPALARVARERGVDVFFITGRPEQLRASTERNLGAAGYTWTGVIFKPDHSASKFAADFKAAERKKLVEQGYAIIANVGDQMSGLEGGFADRTYKLPNPLYFVP